MGVPRQLGGILGVLCEPQVCFTGSTGGPRSATGILGVLWGPQGCFGGPGVL